MDTSDQMAVGEPTAWREGEVLVVRRGQTMPPLCVLSGKPATQRVSCLFHWHERPVAGGGPGSLLGHYARDVWKVRLEVPLADNLIGRRRVGWILFILTALLATGAIASLVGVQIYVARLEKGPEREWLEDWGVPLIAICGFLPTLVAALTSYYVMPMPTVRLKPMRVDQSHIWLHGAAPEFLEQLPDRTPVT